MKKLFFLLAVALPCLIFTACGDDDDDTPTPGASQPGGNVGSSENSNAAEGALNGHTWVDLGLSVKWATCNVGADSPEDYGNYFAWGETQPKPVYNLDTYFDRDGIKYWWTSRKTILDPVDDAATANWGSGWRMPTRAEQDELCSKCTWTWTTQNGVYGQKVTGPNGRSIFLPAAGDSFGGIHTTGHYWSRSLYDYDSYYAYNLAFYSDSVQRSSCSRCYGLSVRPVCQ